MTTDSRDGSYETPHLRIASCADLGWSIRRRQRIGPRIVSLDETLSNPRLVGYAVDIAVCAGIPLSDAPHQPGAIILFRCGANTSEVADGKKAVIGLMTQATLFKPAGRWSVGDSPVFKGRFRGVLRKGTPEEDMQGVLVLDLNEVEFYSAVAPE